jgi:ABC-type multidrug transport system permease subunit
VSEDREQQSDLSELHAITRDARQISMANLEMLADSASTAGFAPMPMPLKIMPTSVLHTIEGLEPTRKRAASAASGSSSAQISPSASNVSLKDSVTEKYATTDHSSSTLPIHFVHIVI